MVFNLKNYSIDKNENLLERWCARWGLVFFGLVRTDALEVEFLLYGFLSTPIRTSSWMEDLLLDLWWFVRFFFCSSNIASRNCLWTSAVTFSLKKALNPGSFSNCLKSMRLSLFCSADSLVVLALQLGSIKLLRIRKHFLYYFFMSNLVNWIFILISNNH